MRRNEKNAVRAAFSAASGTYDASSPLQREAGNELISIIRSLKTRITPRFILDAGCGTGRLSRALKEEFPDSEVIACDFALPMLVEAGKATRRGALRARLVAGDVDSMPFADCLFDIVASNLTYQWPPDALSAFMEAARILKNGGTLAFSTLGPDTLKELRDSCSRASLDIAPMPFIEMDELAASLGCAGLDSISIKRQVITKEYANMRALVRALNDIGAVPHPAAMLEGLAIGVLLKKAGRIYSANYPGASGNVTATYDVIYATARKP